MTAVPVDDVTADDTDAASNQSSTGDDIRVEEHAVDMQECTLPSQVA